MPAEPDPPVAFTAASPAIVMLLLALLAYVPEPTPGALSPPWAVMVPPSMTISPADDCMLSPIAAPPPPFFPPGPACATSVAVASSASFMVTFAELETRTAELVMLACSVLDPLMRRLTCRSIKMHERFWVLGCCMVIPSIVTVAAAATTMLSVVVSTPSRMETV